MAIPDYQSLMLPVLSEASKGAGEVRISDVRGRIAEQLELTPEDLGIRLPSGRQGAFENKVHWAKFYLGKAGLIESTRWGRFKITARGQQVLDAHPARIDNDFLDQFEEFRQFKKSAEATPQDRLPIKPASVDQTETPDEIMRVAHRQIETLLAQELLHRIRASPPDFFERLIVSLLLNMGYGGSVSDAGHALGGSGDDGVDGVIDQDALGLDRVYVQAKHYGNGNNIGPGAIRDFFGSLDRHKAAKGLFVTTSEFSPAARETAKLLSKRIVLIDGEQLTALMIRHNVGCRVEDTNLKTAKVTWPHRAAIDPRAGRRGGRVNRRELMLLLGGMAVARPLAAQQPERVRRIGVLISLPESDPAEPARLTAFVQALERLGWVEGKNIRIDYRFAASDPTLFKTYAAELVGLAPDVILATSSSAVAALRQLTRTIPIVFSPVADPVGQGFVQSLARPGGNLTGFSTYGAELMGKWVQLLKEVAPSVTRVAVIFNPDTAPHAPMFNRAIEAAAPSFGITVTLAPVHDDAGIEAAIATHAREPGGGLINFPESFSDTHKDVIIAAALRHGLPQIGQPNLTRAGGLMSYYLSIGDEYYAQAAPYIDRILWGASPADLPVQQPVKYSLIINLRTAKALGLTVPQSILQNADEVIE
jgi:restriction system protein